MQCASMFNFSISSGKVRKKDSQISQHGMVGFLQTIEEIASKSFPSCIIFSLTEILASNSVWKSLSVKASVLLFKEKSRLGLFL